MSMFARIGTLLLVAAVVALAAPFCALAVETGCCDNYGHGDRGATTTLDASRIQGAKAAAPAVQVNAGAQLALALAPVVDRIPVAAPQQIITPLRV